MSAPGSFELFGAAHLAALAMTMLTALVSSWWLRRDRDRGAWLPRALAVLLVGVGVGYPALDLAMGRSWREVAPLHICDAAVFIGALALVTRRQLVYELLYFWGLAGTTAALLTPDLGETFPSYRFVAYFLQHGGIVVAALLLTVGAGMRPTKGAAWRAFGWLNAYAALVLVFDVATGANFLYLLEPPGAATPLVWFGGWPWYVLVSEGVALALFQLLALPTARAPERARSE